MTEDNDLEDVLEKWMPYFRENWPAIRQRSALVYVREGRFAFLIDITKTPQEELSDIGGLEILTRSQAMKAYDAYGRMILDGEFFGYDPKREVIFGFWNSKSGALELRAIYEGSDGLPVDSLSADPQDTDSCREHASPIISLAAARSTSRRTDSNSPNHTPPKNVTTDSRSARGM